MRDTQFQDGPFIYVTVEPEAYETRTYKIVGKGLAGARFMQVHPLVRKTAALRAKLPAYAQTSFDFSGDPLVLDAAPISMN